MFITNLKDHVVGVDGVINLAPKEKDRYVDENYKDLYPRCLSLQAEGLISINLGEGLTKTGEPLGDLVAAKATVHVDVEDTGLPKKADETSLTASLEASSKKAAPAKAKADDTKTDTKDTKSSK